jgi:hypothetical protein
MWRIVNYNEKMPRTATCDKAGQPNDVCPCGQMMLPAAEVYFVSDVTPDGVMGKHHIIATIGSNIIMSEANNITFA